MSIQLYLWAGIYSRAGTDYLIKIHATFSFFLRFTGPIAYGALSGVSQIPRISILCLKANKWLHKYDLFLLTVVISMWTCVTSLRTGTFTLKSNKCHLMSRKSDWKVGNEQCGVWLVMWTWHVLGCRSRRTTHTEVMWRSAPVLHITKLVFPEV